MFVTYSSLKLEKIKIKKENEATTQREARNKEEREDRREKKKKKRDKMIFEKSCLSLKLGPALASPIT